MKRRIGWHRRLAHWIGYDIDKFNKQITVETHLRENLPRWGIDVVLDVGANIGQFATMLRDIGYSGKIISFEPGKAAYEQLSKNCADDPGWDAYNYALGNAEENLELNVSRSSVFSSFHPVNSFGKEKYGDALEATTTEQVAVRRLDHALTDVLPNHEAHTIFLKMDTQGHDHKVIEGADTFKTSFRAILSEIAVTPIYEDIPDYMESMALYRSIGYEVTGLYVVNRHRDTGHVIEFDCVMAKRP
ncbi:MAG: FkbM family methyltransferase [Pseudomonadales bacterium]